VATDAARFLETTRGVGARRLAIWVCLVGLPLAYEATGMLPGPSRFYAGDASYWFSGFEIRVVLAAIGLAAVAWALVRSRRGLATLGWPRHVPWWQAVIAAVLFLGCVALALHSPGTVSGSAAGASASTPATLLERWCQVVLVVVEAPIQELIWRGALITWLEPSLGTVGASLFAGASYLMFHPTFAVTWQMLVISGLLTCAYTGLYLWRRNLAPSILLHVLVLAGQLLVPVPS